MKRPTTSELTDLERKYTIRKDLALSAAKIDEILAGVNSDLESTLEKDKDRVAELLEGHELQSRRVSEALEELNRWQNGIAQTGTIETADAEREATALETCIEGGYVIIDEMSMSKEKSVDLIKTAHDRVVSESSASLKADAEARLSDTRTASASESKSLFNTLSGKDDDEEKRVGEGPEQCELEVLRKQVAKSKGIIQKAELKAQTMARQMREVQDNSVVIRDEYDREMSTLSKVIANLEHKDRIAHLKWRDNAALSGYETNMFRASKQQSPEAQQKQRDIERLSNELLKEGQKLANANDELRTTRALVCELEDDLKQTRHELFKASVKDENNVGIEPLHEEVQRIIASKSTPSMESLVQAGSKLAQRATPAWDAAKTLISHLEPAFDKERQAAADEAAKREKKFASQLAKERSRTLQKQSSGVATREIDDGTSTQDRVALIEACEQKAKEAEERAFTAENSTTVAKEELLALRTEFAKMLSNAQEAEKMLNKQLKETELEVENLRQSQQYEREVKQKKRQDLRARLKQSKSSLEDGATSQKTDLEKGASELTDHLDELLQQEADLEADIEHQKYTLENLQRKRESQEGAIEKYKRELADLEERKRGRQGELEKLELHCERLKSEIVFAQPKERFSNDNLCAQSEKENVEKEEEESIRRDTNDIISSPLGKMELDHLIQDRVSLYSSQSGYPSMSFQEMQHQRIATDIATDRPEANPTLSFKATGSREDLCNYVDAKLCEIFPPSDNFRSKNEICQYIDERLDEILSVDTEHSESGKIENKCESTQAQHTTNSNSKRKTTDGTEEGGEQGLNRGDQSGESTLHSAEYRPTATSVKEGNNFAIEEDEGMLSIANDLIAERAHPQSFCDQEHSQKVLQDVPPIQLSDNEGIHAERLATGTLANSVPEDSKYQATPIRSARTRREQQTCSRYERHAFRKVMGGQEGGSHFGDGSGHEFGLSLSSLQPSEEEKAMALRRQQDSLQRTILRVPDNPSKLIHRSASRQSVVRPAGKKVEKIGFQRSFNSRKGKATQPALHVHRKRRLRNVKSKIQVILSLVRHRKVSPTLTRRQSVDADRSSGQVQTHTPLREIEDMIRTMMNGLQRARKNLSMSNSDESASVEHVGVVEKYLQNLDVAVDSLAYTAIPAPTSSFHQAPKIIGKAFSGEMDDESLQAASLLREHLSKLQDAVGEANWARAENVMEELFLPDDDEDDQSYLGNEPGPIGDWVSRARHLLTDLVISMGNKIGHNIHESKGFDVALDTACATLARWISKEQSAYLAGAGSSAPAHDSMNLDAKIHELLRRNDQIEKFLEDLDLTQHAKNEGIRHVENDASPQHLKFPIDHMNLWTAKATVASIMHDDQEMPRTEPVKNSAVQPPSELFTEPTVIERVRSIRSIVRKNKRTIGAVLQASRAMCRMSTSNERILGNELSTTPREDGNSASREFVQIQSERTEKVVKEDSRNHIELDNVQIGPSLPGDDYSPPDVPNDAEFAQEVEKVVEGISNESSSVAEIALSLGKLKVMKGCLEQLESKLTSIEKVNQLSEENELDLRCKKATVESRTKRILAHQRRILDMLAACQLSALVPVRHEMACLAKKAKAMAIWLSRPRIHEWQVFGSIRAAAQALSEEINSRGGWRAFIRLHHGEINTNIDPTLWPLPEAVEIWEELVNYYVNALAIERNRAHILEEDIAVTKDALVNVTNTAADEAASRDKLSGEVLRKINEKQENKSSGAIIQPDSLPMAWQREREAAAKIHFGLVATLQVALRSPLASILKLSPFPKAQAKLKASGQPAQSRIQTVREQSDDISPVIESDGWVTKRRLDKSRFVVGKVHARPKPHQVQVRSERQSPRISSPRPEIEGLGEERTSELTTSSFPEKPESSVLSAMQLLKRVEKVGVDLQDNEMYEELLRELHPEIVDGLQRDVTDLRVMNDFVKMAVSRDKQLTERIELLENEIDMLARSHIATQKTLRSLQVAYESENATCVIQSLRRDLEAAQEVNERAATAVTVLRQTSDAACGQGRLELLETMMRRHQRVSAIHAALLPKYDEVEAELIAVLAKLKENKGGVRPEKLRHHSAKLVRQRDELELRLYLAFRDAEEVEKLMVQLYERVEAATQYIFSGQNYRSMLIWAADKESHFNQPPSPRLAAAARATAAPVRTILHSPLSLEELEILQRKKVRKIPLPGGDKHGPSHCRKNDLTAAALFPSKTELKEKYGTDFKSTDFHLKPKLRPVRSAFRSSRPRKSNNSVAQ